MKRSTTMAVAALVATVSQPVLAADYLVQPVPVGMEVARFDRGVPTLDLQGRSGAVQVTPLGLEHGNLVFGVAVYNDGRMPADFAANNISVTSGGLPVRVLTTDELVSKAKSRALWRSLAVAAVGGIAAGISASRTDHYRTTVRSGGRTYRASYSAPSIAGRIQAQQITLATGASVGLIQAQLDQTRTAIGDQTVQLTTVAPTDSYAGRIVLQRIKPGALPQRVDIAIEWNGEHYPFSFQLARKGTAAPVFAARAPTPAPTPAPLVAPTVMPAVVVAPAPTAFAARPIIASTATVAPGVVAVRPVAVRYAPVPAPQNAYQRALAAEQGVHGRDRAQGWSISD